MNKQTLKFSCLLLVAIPVVIQSTARAYESEDLPGYQIPEKRIFLPQENSSQDRLRKFNLALDSLGVPAEEAAHFQDFPDPGLAAESDIQSRLKLMDPDAGLARYFQIQNNTLSFFQDFFNALFPQNLLEYSTQLKSNGASQDSSELLQHLQTISDQVKNPRIRKPLTGLKLVIDPGHMGNSFWDQESGKYVEIGSTKVSEGQINLWTALLVANDLEELGATVVLTRTQNGTVSSETLDTFDEEKYIHQYYYNSLDDWMAPYLSLSDTELKSTIHSKPEVQKVSTIAQKSQFFIMGEDLEARSLIIDREKSDVVLDIHYDAHENKQLQNSEDSVEAFVPGAVRGNETGSRKNRAYALKHLLETRRWNESVALAGEITQSMSHSTQVPLLKSPVFMNAFRVQDGVFTRNLYINRRSLSALTVYLECLHYDHVTEFYELAKNTNTADYHGMSFSYPPRVRLVANGIREGLLNYLKR